MDISRNLPQWLQEHVPVTIDIEMAYKQDISKFGRTRPTGFYNPKEKEIIDELAKVKEESRKLHFTGKGCRHLIKKELELQDWLLDYWQSVGLPAMIFNSNGEYGLKDYKGDIVLTAEYDGILLNLLGYNIFDGTIIVCRAGKWGLVSHDGKEVLPCIYQKILPRSELDYGVKINGKWGIYSSATHKWELPCIHDMIYSNRTSPIELMIFSDNGKFGWSGCQTPDYDSMARYEAVLLPNGKYFYSEDYGDEEECFVALKDRKVYFIEYWTSK